MIFILAFATSEEKEKFDYLYYQYKNLLLYKAYGILKDYMLAEDAASEAYLRIYKNLHKIDDITSKETISFLVTIVKNVSLTMLDKLKRTTSVNLDELVESGNEISDGFDLEAEIISSLSSQQIYDIINSIKEEYRSVFLLKYGHNMSHKEIADSLDISENNVTVRLHRGKTQLQKIMKKEGWTNE